MREFEPHETPEVSVADTARQIFRFVTAFLGLAMILAGIYFAFQLFGVAYTAVTAPERLGPVVDQWAEQFGGDKPVVEADEHLRISSRFAAAGVLGGCLIVLLWLTLAIISTGARIVYWMGTDLDSVKRVLSHVFGPSTIQVVKGPEAKPPKSLSVPPRSDA